jgi:hypothetical protein
MRRSAVVLAGTLASVFLVAAACSSGAESAGSAQSPESSAASSSPASLPAPIFFDPASLQGRTIKISRDIPLVLQVDDSELDLWTGAVGDPGIAGFSAGGSKGSYSVNPAFDAKREGTTAATLTGPDNAKISFTLTVVADNEDVTTSQSG